MQNTLLEHVYIDTYALSIEMWQTMRIILSVFLAAKFFIANIVFFFSDVVRYEYRTGWSEILGWCALSFTISGYRNIVQYRRIFKSMAVSCRQSHESYWEVRSLVTQFTPLRSVINWELSRLFGAHFSWGCVSRSLTRTHRYTHTHTYTHTRAYMKHPLLWQ